MSENISYSERVTADAMTQIFLGKKLGFGISRTVYVCGINKDLVIKIADTDDVYGIKANIEEWNVWNQISEVEGLRNYFAKCHYISDNGVILIQERTYPFRENEKMPDKMPAIFIDIKRENFGKISKQIVCHDYALNLRISNSLNKRMKNVNWF